MVAITPYSTPRLLDERSAQIVAGNLSGGQPSGPGYLAWLGSKGFGTPTPNFAIDVTDEGLDDGSASTPDHEDFYVNGTPPTDRVAYAHDFTSDDSARDCGGHGTNVASIAAGYGAGSSPADQDAQGFKYGMGAAPRVLIGASKIFNCARVFELDDPDGFRGLAADAYAGGAVISNNSWGNADLGHLQRRFARVRLHRA